MAGSVQEDYGVHENGYRSFVLGARLAVVMLAVLLGLLAFFLV